MFSDHLKIDLNPPFSEDTLSPHPPNRYAWMRRIWTLLLCLAFIREFQRSTFFFTTHFFSFLDSYHSCGSFLMLIIFVFLLKLTQHIIFNATRELEKKKYSVHCRPPILTSVSPLVAGENAISLIKIFTTHLQQPASAPCSACLREHKRKTTTINRENIIWKNMLYSM